MKKTRRIKLTQGKYAIVDAENYEWLKQWNWYLHNAKNRLSVYAVRTLRNPRTNIRMHRLIMGAKKGQQIDHINRNGLDNRRINLRFATTSQNCVNSGVRRDKKNGKYKGVYLTPNGTWQARMRINKKEVFVGTFKNPKDAARAYNEMAYKAHGEFAWLNPV